MTRPHAVTTTDLYLRLILDEFEAQGEVLRRILDRLPEPTVAGQPDPAPQQQLVEVSEPAPKSEPTPPAEADDSGPAEVQEPAPPTKPAAPVNVDEPARKAAPAKKTARATRRR